MILAEVVPVETTVESPVSLAVIMTEEEIVHIHGTRLGVTIPLPAEAGYGAMLFCIAKTNEDATARMKEIARPVEAQG